MFMSSWRSAFNKVNDYTFWSNFLKVVHLLGLATFLSLFFKSSVNVIYIRIEIVYTIKKEEKKKNLQCVQDSYLIGLCKCCVRTQTC